MDNFMQSSILSLNYAFKKFYRRISDIFFFFFILNITDMISLSLNMHECPRGRPFEPEFEPMNIQECKHKTVHAIRQQ